MPNSLFKWERAGRHVQFLVAGRHVEVGEKIRTVAGRLSVVWQAMPGRFYGRALTSLTDIWIVWVFQNLARRPPDVCDALPDIRQASTNLLAIRLRSEPVAS